ncbi:MAG: DNA methyltransferase [Spirochaetia bacterium]|nr:DNA methyltransferase [Spirochaetota bacterium]MDW8112599.1 DNA methyltransferase [Spirochaetia bacterium]
MKRIEKYILEDKQKGISDEKIGEKYNVSLKFIEKAIVKSKGLNISNFKDNISIKTLHPKEFREETTTVWSFKNRGNWATHNGRYRGNWSPYIPRNVILKYSEPGDIVLDCFCGSGTTLVEAKLLGRRAIGVDINQKATELARQNLSFKPHTNQLELINQKDHEYEPEIVVGDARNLSFIDDNSIDLICSHPPYANAIQYTVDNKNDLSTLDVDDFLKEIEKVAKENYRVLKTGKKCAILIGDIRRKKYVIPLGFKLIQIYLNTGFKLKELVIKRQHNCKTTPVWIQKSIQHNFLLLSHEYLAIFEKPNEPTKEASTKITENIVTEVYENNIHAEQLVSADINKQLEITTFWQFREKLEENKKVNLLKRYSDGKNYSETQVLYKRPKIIVKRNIAGKGNSLAIIKLDITSEITRQEFREIVNCLTSVLKQETDRLENKSIIAIDVKDQRIEGYIENIPIKVLNSLEELKIKEIIILDNSTDSYSNKDKCENLRITHRYVLVMEVLK